jgi:hypothetical protein
MIWYRAIATAVVVSISSAISYAQTDGPSTTSDAPKSTSTSAPTPAEQLKAQTDITNAQKGLIEAELGRAEAQQRLQNARIGTVTGQTEIKGVVTPGADPGRAEALLMVTASTIAASRQIRDAIEPTLRGYQDRDVLVLTSNDELSAPDSVVFEMRLNLLNQAFATAERRFSDAVERDSQRRVAQANTILPALDLLVGNIARLGSYFQTDYTFGQIKPDLPEELLSAAVIQSFSSSNPMPRFIVPAHSIPLDPGDISSLLAPSQASYAQAATHRSTAERRARELEAGEAAEPELRPLRLLYQESVTALTQAMTRYEDYMNSLFASTEGRDPPIIKIIRQRQIRQLLAANPRPLALLLTGRQVGAYYTRRSLWNFLSGAPLHTMGGTSTTFTLFDTGNGHVLRAGAVAHHAGYRSVRDVERIFATPSTGGRGGN